MSGDSFYEPTSPGFVANNVIFLIVQMVMALSIIGFTAHSLNQQKSSKSQSLWYITIPNLVFNLDSLYCLAAICICPMAVLLGGEQKLDATTRRLYPCDGLCKDYIPFVQTITFIVVLFLRCIDIFKNSEAHKITLRTKIIFCLALALSLSLWISLISADWVLPNSEPWVSCIITLCMVHTWFALWVEVLIISKLVRVVSAHVHQEQHRRTAQGIRHLITKSALLGAIALTSSIVACFFFLSKLHEYGNNSAVHAMSDWIISFDIYLNFLANLLTHATYGKLYQKLCQPLHTKCDLCFQKIVFSSKWNADASQMLNPELQVQSSSNQEPIATQPAALAAQKSAEMTTANDKTTTVDVVSTS